MIFSPSRLAMASAILLAAGAAKAEEVYGFDPGHTEIIFTYSHFGQSTAYGQLNAYDGVITLDADDPAASSIDVTIDAASLDSGFEALDTHLRSADFFDVETYPQIRFVSTEVRPTGDDSAEVTGNLTIKDVTKPVTLTVRLNYKGRHALADFVPEYDVEVAGFSASASVKRSEFGLGMFAPGVSDEVGLIIETELFRQK